MKLVGVTDLKRLVYHVQGTLRFNRELWKGIMGDKPYPKQRSGKNLRENRAAFLTDFGIDLH